MLIYLGIELRRAALSAYFARIVLIINILNLLYVLNAILNIIIRVLIRNMWQKYRQHVPPT